ncbi:O-antigen ligase family protein [Flavobacteriaceae bacterium]|nr:O-antigen ligase family protein [Flavobacteriaceae bacterium]
MSKTVGKILLGLYFFAFTIPQDVSGLYIVFDRVSIQVLYISVLNLFVILYLLKSINLKFFIDHIRYKNHYISYLLVIICSFLSLTYTENLIEGIITFSKFFTLFISFSLIIYIVYKSKIDFIRLFFMFIVVALIAETYVINSKVFQSVILNGDLLTRSMNFRGFTGNINISSFSILIKLPVLIYMIYKEKKHLYLFLLNLLLISSLVSILVLFSRAAIIGLILVVIVSLLYYLVKEKRKVVVQTILVSLSICISYLTYNFLNEKNTFDVIEERFSTVSQPSNDKSVSQRVTFYRIALEDIKNYPLTGIGIGSWKLLSIQRSNEILGGYMLPYMVHNDFLEIAAESGVLSLFSYLFFIFFPFIISLKRSINFKNNNLHFLVLTCLSIYILDSLINFPMHRVVSSINFYFTLALFYYITIKNNHEVKKYF